MKHDKEELQRFSLPSQLVIWLLHGHQGTRCAYANIYLRSVSHFCAAHTLKTIVWMRRLGQQQYTVHALSCLPTRQHMPRSMPNTQSIHLASQQRNLNSIK